MANPTFPLPHKLILPFTRVERPNQVVTAFDAGEAQVRRRFSRRIWDVDGEIVVVDKDLDTLEAFWGVTLVNGTGRFDWVDPKDGETVREFRFAPGSALETTMITPRGNRVRLRLEMFGP